MKMNNSILSSNKYKSYVMSNCDKNTKKDDEKLNAKIDTEKDKKHENNMSPVLQRSQQSQITKISQKISEITEISPIASLTITQQSQITEILPNTEQHFIDKQTTNEAIFDEEYDEIEEVFNEIQNICYDYGDNIFEHTTTLEFYFFINGQL